MHNIFFVRRYRRRVLDKMSDNDETLSNFMAVTACSEPEVARAYLEAAKWDLNEALNLFLGGKKQVIII